jgi:D-alanyl-D-alanine carboxypeptidase
MVRLLTAHLPLASAGAKTTSVFKENGVRVTADAGDTIDDDDTPEVVAAPVKVATAPIPAASRADPADSVQPTMLLAMAPPSAPVPAAKPAIDPTKPRIAASDVVPIAPTTRETRTSSDHGAAVAMARAILLPEAGKPMRTPVEAPVRTAAVTVPVPAPAAEARGAKPSAPAATVLMAREVAPPTTASIARTKPEETAPKLSKHTGWIVQIGAYDTDKAARAALDKARGKGGATLTRAEGFTEEAVMNTGRLWRARFAGFADQKRAEDACKALKRMDFACLALRQ